MAPEQSFSAEWLASVKGINRMATAATRVGFLKNIVSH